MVFRNRTSRRAELLEQRLALVAPEGFFDAIDPGFVVSGWAMDRDELPRSIDVQIRIDGDLIATITTGLPRPDVGVPGDHGFRWQIPDRFLDGNEHIVRVAAVDPDGGPRVPLGGSPKTFRNALPQGYFDAIDPGFVVSGWAADTDSLPGPSQVAIRIDGQLVDTVVADLPRLDIPFAGNHAFNWEIPERFMDGNEHEIHLEALDTHGGPSAPMGFSPKTFRNSRPLGNFDAIDPGFVVSGWARDSDSTPNPIQVEIHIDGQLVDTVRADVPRLDLGPNSNHGFRWTIPASYLDRREHRVEVFAIDADDPTSRTPLSGGPKVFQGGGTNQLYLVFDGYEISSQALQRWSADWGYRPEACLDRDRNGVSIAPLFPDRPDREQIIEKIFSLVRNDLAPFGFIVHRHTNLVVEGEGATTIFVGRSTTCHPHIASDIDVGNDNKTDIAFVGPENWGTVDLTALALADIILHEAGHTFGLYHVMSGERLESMGFRYNTPSRLWAQDTSFLDETFSIKPGHGPTGFQNSFQVMKSVFGVVAPSLLSLTLDLTPPPADFVPEFSRPYEYHLTGDVNDDGVFDSTDLLLVFQAGEYEDGIGGNSVWEDGDWNGDGDFDSGDLVFAFQAGAYVA